MHLVNEKDLPRADEIVDVPLDNPLLILKTCIEMQELCEDKGGIGLSAVQVGLPWKLFIVKAIPGVEFETPNRYGYFINCNYEPTVDAKKVISIEGCLSIRSTDGYLRYFKVDRYDKIKVIGLKLLVYRELHIDKCNFVCDLTTQSNVFQHEIQHHQGKLISDTGREIFE